MGINDGEEKELISTATSATKASVTVILVLLYGYVCRKRRIISAETESNVSSFGTSFLLPCLLFSEIGPLATPSNLGNCAFLVPAL